MCLSSGAGIVWPLCVVYAGVALSLCLAHILFLFFALPFLFFHWPDIVDHLEELADFKEEHPDLASSVDALPAVMMADRAPATVVKYSNAFHRWTEWAKEHHMPNLPAPPVGVACYLLEIGGSAKSPAPISSALHGIDWAHRKAGLRCPSSHHVLRQSADGLIRCLSKPATKMQPLTADHLSRLMERFGKAGCSLVDLQMLCLMTLGFHGFFRWSDLHEIRLPDVRFSDGYVSIFLEGRKNDQFREGHLIPIAETGSEVCPVNGCGAFSRKATISPGVSFSARLQSAELRPMYEIG